jgi:hypothetical protein
MATAPGGSAPARRVPKRSGRARGVGAASGRGYLKDGVGATCRRGTWKDADHTRLTAETRDAFLVIEGLPPAGRAEVSEAAEALAELMRIHCGDGVRTALLDRDEPKLLWRSEAKTRGIESPGTMDCRIHTTAYRLATTFCRTRRRSAASCDGSSQVAAARRTRTMARRSLRQLVVRGRWLVAVCGSSSSPSQVPSTND